MTSRRQFLEGSLSAVLAALTGRGVEDDRYPSAEQNGNSAPTCDACATIAERTAEWLFTPMTEDKRAAFETLMRPEQHAWTPECEYRRLAVSENVFYDAADFQEMEYTIASDFSHGFLSVAVSFQATEPLRYISTTIEVGGTDG